MKRYIVVLISILVLGSALIASIVQSGTITKGTISKQDIRLYYSDGSGSTFDRTTSAGYDMTLNVVDWPGIDALQVYGNGVNATKNTLDTMVADIGTNHKVKVYMAPVVWTFTTDDGSFDYSSYDNIIWDWAPGAKMDISPANTGTFASPDSFEAAPTQQITYSDCSLRFGSGGTTYPQWWGFLASETGANNRTSLAAAVASLTDGGILHIPAGDYSVTSTGGTININVQFFTLRGDGWATKIEVTGDTNFILCNSSGAADGSATKRGINIEDIYFAHASADPTANTCECLEFTDVQKHVVSGCRFAYFDNGITLNSRDNVHITRNWFTQCDYGIKCEDFFTSITLQDVHITDNVYEGCTAWDFYCVADVKDIWFQREEHAMGAGTGSGIYIVTGEDTADQGYHFENLTFENFASGKNAIHLDNANSKKLSNVSIKGCRFLTTDAVALTVENTEYISVTDCYFNQNATHGGTVYAFDSDCRAVYFANNKHADETDMGTRTISSENCHVEQYHKIIDRNANNKNTSGTGEDDLRDTTIYLETLGPGGGIRIQASGTITGANNTKVIKLYFGATSITAISAAAGDQTDWNIDATIFNTATNSQVWKWMGLENDGTITSGNDTSAIDTAAADVTVKLTGECADVGDTITQKLWVVELLQGEMAVQ